MRDCYIVRERGVGEWQMAPKTDLTSISEE